MTLFDVVADQLPAALASIERQLTMLEGDGLLREGQTAASLMKSVSVSSDLKEAMEGTDYVQVIFQPSCHVQERAVIRPRKAVDQFLILGCCHLSE